MYCVYHKADYKLPKPQTLTTIIKVSKLMDVLNPNNPPSPSPYLIILDFA